LNPQVVNLLILGNNTGVTVDGFTIQGDGGATNTVVPTDNASNFTLTNCRLVGSDVNDSGGVHYFGGAMPASGLLVSNCSFTGWDRAVNVDGPANISGLMVLNNSFRDNEVGLRMVRVVNPFVTGNGFHDNNAAIGPPGQDFNNHIAVAIFSGTVVSGDISGNDFTGGGSVDNYVPANLFIVENNWWGQAAGPLPAQTMVVGTAPVDADPASAAANTNLPAPP
jgi:hypothetical protein